MIKRGNNGLGKKKKKGERHIPMNLVLGGALSSSSESEILFFKTGSSFRFSKTSSDLLDDKSTLGVHVR